MADVHRCRLPGDIKFKDVLRNYDANARHPEVVKPGAFNDPDYLAPELGMTDEEFRTQLTLWAVAAAPLMIGSDIRKLSATIDRHADRPRRARDQPGPGRGSGRPGRCRRYDGDVGEAARRRSRAVVLLNRVTARRR